MSRHEELTVAFLDRWAVSFDEMVASFRDSFTDHSVWDQRPIPRIRGAEQAVRFLRLTRAGLGLATVEVELLHVASAGDRVHTERVDHLRRAARAVPALVKRGSQRGWRAVRTVIGK